MSIDLASTLRKFKPARHAASLVPRSRERLVALADASPSALLLDTNVYINLAADRIAAPLCDIIDRALLFHCSVALAELSVGVANADPARRGWGAMRDHYTALFAAIPASRLLTPDAQVWIDAGILAGTLARTQRLQPHQRKECLNDALILLTAAKAGIAVLTSNRDEFDMLQQIAPEGRFVHY